MKIYVSAEIQNRLYNVHSDLVRISQEPLYFIIASEQCYEYQCYEYSRACFIANAEGDYVKILGGDGCFYFVKNSFIGK